MLCVLLAFVFLCQGQVRIEPQPSNVRTVTEFDPSLGVYVVKTMVGDMEVSTPIYLTPEQYSRQKNREILLRYFRERDQEPWRDDVEEKPFSVFDMNFRVGPLERIFGPGGVSVRTQGNITISTGIKSTKTDNPALNLDSRRKTYFDFDQKIQATIQATVGDRLKFGMSYNTDATFDFDAKNIKLAYEGKEDDIVKSIEAGNVQMTTGGTLIRGSSALFGVKTKMQFGRLTATALVSQQNSQSTSVSTKGGAQTTEFVVRADDYDQNRHFFLAHYFRDNYNSFASRLPLVTSGIKITRIEVWVTNKNSRFSQSRNFVAFADLGENSHLTSNYWQPNMAQAVPSNSSNNLLETMRTEYASARNINMVTQTLAPLSAYGIEGGTDFEKVESARLLDPSD